MKKRQAKKLANKMFAKYYPISDDYIPILFHDNEMTIISNAIRDARLFDLDIEQSMDTVLKKFREWE